MKEATKRLLRQEEIESIVWARLDGEDPTEMVCVWLSDVTKKHLVEMPLADLQMLANLGEV